MPWLPVRPLFSALVAGLIATGAFLPVAAIAQETGAERLAAVPTPVALRTARQAPAAAAIAIEIPAFRQAVAEAAASDESISAFYRARAHAPIWTGANDAPRRAAFLSALARAGDHGLPIARYDPAALREIFARVETERDRGFAEVEMTRAFIRYARDASSGVIDPAAISSDQFKRVLPRPDTLETLTAFVDAPPAAFLRNLLPRAPEYARLLRARNQLQDQIATGGWGARIRADSLAPGDTGEQVVTLRNRLIAMGYLDRSATASYDVAIQTAVQRFQINHGLLADGIAGRTTIAALNIDPQDRLRSVLVAMERERWLNIPRGERHIWVNLTVHDSRGSGGLKGPSGACLGPRVECLAWPMDDPVSQSIEAGSEP